MHSKHAVIDIPTYFSPQNNITADNYNAAIMAVSIAVREAVNNEQKQTPENLAIVAAVFITSAAIVNNQISVEQAVCSLLLQVTYIYHCNNKLAILTTESWLQSSWRDVCYEMFALVLKTNNCIREPKRQLPSSSQNQNICEGITCLH